VEETMSNNSLDKRIGDALAADDISATDLAAVIVETEQALTDAVTAATKIKAEALDPLVMLDAVKARAATEAADFAVQRLKASLARLQTKYAAAEAAESVARWEADRAAVEQQVLHAAKEFERVPGLIAELVSIFTATEAVDRAVSEVNARSPSGARTLCGVELVCRNLAAFSAGDKSIKESSVLFGEKGQLWPPRRSSFAASIMPTPSYDARFTAHWHEASGERTRQIELDQARLSEHYAALTREQSARQERETEEARAKRTAHA